MGCFPVARTLPVSIKKADSILFVGIFFSDFVYMRNLFGRFASDLRICFSGSRLCFVLLVYLSDAHCHQYESRMGKMLPSKRNRITHPFNFTGSLFPSKLTDEVFIFEFIDTIKKSK